MRVIDLGKFMKLKRKLAILTAAALIMAAAAPVAASETGLTAAAPAAVVAKLMETAAPVAANKTAVASAVSVAASEKLFVASLLAQEAGESLQIDGAAALCRDLGILRGHKNGVNSVYLSEFTTRMQAIYITVRLKGEENAALTYRIIDSFDISESGEFFSLRGNFRDAQLVESENGRNVLAYVKANPRMGWQGDDAGNINPYGYMTSQAMYKVLLTALGYNAGDDFLWEDTVAFAGEKGMSAFAQKHGFLSNNDISVMIVEALKTRMKDSDMTLCEFLAGIGAVDEGVAYAASMLPGSPGFEPLLTYAEGGPLLLNVELIADQSTIKIRLNTALNPTYAKALKNYSYYVPETGYNMPDAGYAPLPAKTMTSMADERTVVIKFPDEGWQVADGADDPDAFMTYIAAGGNGRLLISGLYDVDGEPLRDVYINIPEA